MENIKKETQAACLFCRVPVLKEPPIRRVYMGRLRAHLLNCDGVKDEEEGKPDRKCKYCEKILPYRRSIIHQAKCPRAERPPGFGSCAHCPQEKLIPEKDIEVHLAKCLPYIGELLSSHFYKSFREENRRSDQGSPKPKKAKTNHLPKRKLRSNQNQKPEVSIVESAIPASGSGQQDNVAITERNHGDPTSKSTSDLRLEIHDPRSLAPADELQPTSSTSSTSQALTTLTSSQCPLCYVPFATDQETMMHIKEEHAAGDDNDYLRTCVQNEEKKVANVINVNRCDFCHVVVESEKILREQHPITCLGLKRLEKFTECEFSSKSLPISWQLLHRFVCPKLHLVLNKSNIESMPSLKCPNTNNKECGRSFHPKALPFHVMDCLRLKEMDRHMDALQEISGSSMDVNEYRKSRLIQSPVIKEANLEFWLNPENEGPTNENPTMPCD